MQFSAIKQISCLQGLGHSLVITHPIGSISPHYAHLKIIDSYSRSKQSRRSNTVFRRKKTTYGLFSLTSFNIEDPFWRF